MSLGSGGSLNTSRKEDPAGAGFITSANNGLSENPAGTVVLGQDVGAVGDPAQLLNAREIPAGSFPITIRGATTALGINRIEFVEGSLINVFGDTTNGPGFPAPAIVFTDIANPGNFLEIFQALDTGALLPMSSIRNQNCSIALYPSQQVAIGPNAYNPRPPAQYFFDVTGDSRLNGKTVTGKFVDITTASPVPIGPDESRKQFGNYAAGLKVFDLPSAAPGLNFGFYVGHTDGVSINPVVTDTIRITATLGAAGANATSTTVGDYIELSCMNAGEWFASVVTGAGWTV